MKSGMGAALAFGADASSGVPDLDGGGEVGVALALGIGGAVGTLAVFAGVDVAAVVALVAVGGTFLQSRVQVRFCAGHDRQGKSCQQEHVGSTSCQTCGCHMLRSRPDGQNKHLVSRCKRR